MDDLRKLKDYSHADMAAAQNIVRAILLRLLRRDLSPLRSWIDDSVDSHLSDLVNFLLKQVFERCHCTFAYYSNDACHFTLLVEPGRKGLLIAPGEVFAVSTSVDDIAFLPNLTDGVNPLVETLKFGLTDMEFSQSANNTELWATQF